MIIEKTHRVANSKTHCADCGTELRHPHPLAIGARVAVIVGAVVGSYSSYVVVNPTKETTIAT